MMKSVFFGALLASTGLATAVLAQTTQPTNPPQANTCAELVRFLEQRGNAQPASPVTLDQARTWQRANDANACREGATRIQAAGVTLPPTLTQTAQRPADQRTETGAQITVQQPAPQIQVEQAQPQVTVQQPQPQVTVRQPQPEITVRQPAPKVTVDIPQPEIIVRMPQPDVNVAMPQPQVDVRQPQPQVRVVQQEQPQVQVQPAQPQVQVQQPQQQAQVQVQQAEQQPAIKYERAEPQVVVNQPQGQPQVRFEQAPAGQADRAPATTPNRADTPAATGADRPSAVATAQPTPAGNTQAFQISQLNDKKVFNDRGQQLGQIERIVVDQANRMHAVISHGGFLGMGEKQILVSLDRLRAKNDAVIMPGMTDEQVRAMPEFNRQQAAAYREVSREARAELQIAR